MVTAANSYLDKSVVPPLMLSQITTSRQYSRERFPTTSMRSSSWRKLLDRMPLSPKLNVLLCHTAKKHRHAMLTLCSFTSWVRGAPNAVGRYQHDNVTAWTSNRQHATKTRRYESALAYKNFPNRGWSTDTYCGRVREIRDPRMDI